MRRSALGAATAALLLAALSATTATAKSTEIDLTVTGEARVLVGTRHEVLITATKTADDPSNPIGCVEITAPDGWSGLMIEEGVLPTADWTASDGPPATWAADGGAFKLQDLGETAQVRVSVLAPDAEGVGEWGIALHDSHQCSDTPMLFTTFEVDVLASLPELTIDPASATVTAGTVHDVTFTAGWIASDGDAIGCIAVTLPDGWTATGTMGPGGPTGWTSDVDDRVIAWRAGAPEVAVDATGESAGVTVMATAPGTTGTTTWDVEVFTASDCTGEPILTGSAEVIVTAAPVDDDGGDDTGGPAEDLEPAVLAADAPLGGPVPASVPAGGGPAPVRTEAALAVLAGLAATLGTLRRGHAGLRRRGASIPR